MKKFLLTLGVTAMVTSSVMADSFEVNFEGNTNWPNVSGYDTSIVSNTDFGGVKWILSAMNNNNNDATWGFVRFGKKKTDNNLSSLFNDSALPEAVTNVTFTARRIRSTINSAILYVADDVTFTNATAYPLDVQITETTYQDYSIDITNPAPNKFYKLEFDVTNTTSSNGAGELLNVVFTTEGGSASTVAAPKLSLDYSDSSYKVSMSAEEGAEIYYTTNESEPTAESTKYTAPVEVWTSTTFKAVAVKDGQSSPVTTFVANPPEVVDNFMALYGFMDYVPAEGVKVMIDGADYVSVYQYERYLYLYDGMEYMLFYGGNNTYEPGTILSQIEGTFTVYNGLPEIQNYTANVKPGEGNIPSPIETDLDQVAANILNRYVTVKNVEIEEVSDTRAVNYYAVDTQGNRVQVYKRFDVAPVAMEKADITGFVGIYKDAVQLYPISITESIINGVENISAEDTETEYYNLQGVRVANPENGLYIVRKGNKVTKMVIE